MATTVSITGGSAVANGFEIRYTVNGVAGQGVIFGQNVNAVKQWVQDHQFTTDDLIALLMRIWFANDPTLTPSNIIGKVMTVDLTNLAAVVKVV